MKISKVYTRMGDKGMTSLVGGKRISKSSVRLEAYGTVDELSSHLGLLAAMLEESYDREKLMIQTIQNDLFIVGAHLATEQDGAPLHESLHLPGKAIETLETEIDSITALLPESQGFILPGGCIPAAQAHVCRTVCRRAERCIIALSQEAIVDAEILQYINRLSDYLFVLAKKVNHNSNINEIIWQKTCK